MLGRSLTALVLAGVVAAACGGGSSSGTQAPKRASGGASSGRGGRAGAASGARAGESPGGSGPGGSGKTGSGGTAGHAGKRGSAGSAGRTDGAGGGTAARGGSAGQDDQGGSSGATGGLTGSGATAGVGGTAGPGGEAGAGGQSGAGGSGGGAPPPPGSSSDGLIQQALNDGVLDDEQALIYRVFAAFADPRLPVQYRGDSDPLDSNAMIEASQRYPSLTAKAQAILDPFFRPPGDAESWFASRYPVPAARVIMSAHGAARLSDAGGCDPTATGIFQRVTTLHFNIYYMHPDDTPTWDNGEAVANDLALEVEKIWATETNTFGRYPPSDAGITSECNGGDGALDIYVMPDMLWAVTGPGSAKRAVTVPYSKGCGPGPSYILVPDRVSDDTRSAIAHEFFHTLQLGAYELAASCGDYDWLGEATANWAMDLVYPDDQIEQNFAAGYMFAERIMPLDEAYGGDADHTNGYCDYVFFLYLARKFGSANVRTVWDATELFDSVGAAAAGMDGGGGSKTVWPEFALACWNDFSDNVAGDFESWDTLEWGMKKAFDLKDAGGAYGEPSTKIELKGQPRKDFELMRTAAAFPDETELPRLSVHSDYLKFTDSNVRSVAFVNPVAEADFPYFKLQAIVKKGGSWQPPEDWTKEPSKTFCRDKKDERIEELVLIYSNSDDRRPSDPITFPYPPLLSVSNVGCFRWEGTTSVEDDVNGNVQIGSAAIKFERKRPDGLPDGIPGREAFAPTEGQANGTLDGTEAGICTVTEAGQSTIAATEATLDLECDLDLVTVPTQTPDRYLRTLSGSSTFPTHTTVDCGGYQTSSDGNNAWIFSQLPATLTYSVSADGTTIEGNVSTPEGGGARVTKWTLHSTAE